KYVNGSNDNAKYNYSNLTFFAGESDKLNLKIKRNDSIVNKVINRYTSKDIFQKKSINKNAWKNYGDDILYIDYGLITNIELNSVLKASQNKKGIIIDLRNAYQEITLFKLADFLIGKKVHFANILNQNFSYPGSFSLSKQYCGKNNVNSFNGKIVLLVNENTQSHTEFAAMCLQQSPNTITIGSQSSGADGNVFELPLVFEGFSSIFTGIGVTYPDNTQSQRSGVKIDYEIEKNKKSIIENQDTYLKKALELLE